MVSNLEQLSVFVNDTRQPLFTLADLQSEQGLQHVLKTVQDFTDAPTDSVAASIFFRRLGFFFAAQFKTLTVYNKVFAGSLSSVGIIRDDLTFKFVIPEDEFIHIHNKEDGVRFILETFGHPLVETVSKRVKIPKLILWENIWGYVIWIYSQMIAEGVESASSDLDIMFVDAIWKPQLRRSPFKQFLQNKTALEAMKEYKRVTCCLLKEMPEGKKCPYCPQAN